MKILRAIVLVAAFMCVAAHVDSQDLSVIPEPVQYKRNNGSFVLTGAQVISIPSSGTTVQGIARYFNDRIGRATGFSLKTSETAGGNIQLIINATEEPRLGSEGYTMDVSTSMITIRANAPAGLFYGIQTLLQLLPKEIESQHHVANVRWQVPCVTIVDYPRFAWRGVMLDVSRHFFPKEYVKDYIDQIARYKFNRLHWHLTDDNGWRLEIKSLPKLTEVGAWRVPRVGTFGSNDAPRPGEKETYGGFYTQDDVKDIIAYAAERFVQIMPEVDVPGHSMAALAAYPELCVTKDTSIRVNPGSKFSTWHGNGKFTMHIDNTLNPTDEKVYSFLDKVFTEIAGLFPFEYIHIGGDECYKGYWERDSKVQAFMKKNGLKDGVALQGYFTNRVAKMVQGKNKKVIGWDEILEGDLAPGVAVMSWRGTKGGIEAVHQKRTVVMSPAPVYYLDMNQGEPSIEPPIYSSARLQETYDHEVIPDGVDSTYILGGQGNLWTEQIPTSAQVEYMTYPRALALSESFWSPRDAKNFERFVAKVEDHFGRLDAAEVNYAPSMYDPIIRIRKTKDSEGLAIELLSEVPGLTLHYTFDNTVPNKYSPAYNNEPLTYPDGADNFRVISYRDGKPIGRLITLKTEDVQKRARR